MDPSTETQQQETTTTESKAPGVPAEVLSRLEALEKENKALRDESASKRVKAREAQLAAEKAAEEQGQHKALAESLKQRLAELEPLEGDAKAWRAHLEREQERLAKVRETLPQHWQAAFDASTSLEGKQKLLAAYEADRSTSVQTKQPAKAPGAGNPPGAASTDWQQLAASDPAALREAKVRDPQGWAAFTQKLMGGGAKVLTTFERRQQAMAANKK